MGKVNKRVAPAVAGRVHKTRGLPEDRIRFSFKFFDGANGFGCEAVAENVRAGYWPAFMDRLKSLSDMLMSEFRTKQNRVLRNHTHDWAKTSCPEGFSCLPQQLQDIKPWQFCIDQSRYGRVHGIILDEVFYVIWLDPEHRLYPAEN